MRRLADQPEFDPSAVLLAMELEDARGIADRVATAWFEQSTDGLDPQGFTILLSALADSLPSVTPEQVPGLVAAIADSARALAASRWRALGEARPETPIIDKPSVYGALLIHLHESPEGPMALVLRQHHEEQLRLRASFRLWRSNHPTPEQFTRFARSLRVHEESLSACLASLTDHQ